MLTSNWSESFFRPFLFFCRARSRSPLSAAVSMTWIPRSACPLRLARTRPSHLLQLLGSSLMPTSSAKSSVSSWRQSGPMSKSVSLILLVRGRWSLWVSACVCVPSVHRSALGCVSRTHYLFHMSNPYLSVSQEAWGDTAVPLPGYCLIFVCLI